MKFFIFFTLYVSIASGQEMKVINVYPNPNDGEVNIDIHLMVDYNASYYSNIEIYNLKGEQVKVIPVYVGGGGIRIVTSFSMSQYPTGIYFIRIVAGFVFISKFVLIK